MSEKEQEGGRRRGRGREIWEELHMHTMHAHTQAHTHTHTAKQPVGESLTESKCSINVNSPFSSRQEEWKCKIVQQYVEVGGGVVVPSVSIVSDKCSIFKGWLGKVRRLEKNATRKHGWVEKRRVWHQLLRARDWPGEGTLLRILPVNTQGLLGTGFRT